MIFVKVASIKYSENSFSGNGADTCGQTDGQTDITELIGVFGD